MRYAILAVLCVVGMGTVEAWERPIEELPRDVWRVASAWSEPVKHIARDTRRFDPISGLWFGLLEGSVKSMERTAEFFLKGTDTPRQQRDPRLLRYSF
jgi:hypothetical protein